MVFIGKNNNNLYLYSFFVKKYIFFFCNIFLITKSYGFIRNIKLVESKAFSGLGLHGNVV